MYNVIGTQQKMNNLFQVDENSIEQYFAAHIVLGNVSEVKNHIMFDYLNMTTGKTS